jgi:hypothetical protein
MEENRIEIGKLNSIRSKIKEGLKEFSNLIFSIRFLVTVMIFLGVALQYAQKIDMGIAIVCMVNHTALNDTDTTNNNNKSINDLFMGNAIKKDKPLVSDTR